MRAILIGIIGLLVGALVLAGCDSSAPATGTQPQAVRGCSGQFEATIDQGPDAGLTLAGTLTVDVDAGGSMTGVLTPGSGAPVNVVGQVTGRAMNLAVAMADGRYIFGTGTLSNPISECKGVAGGPLVGPEMVKTGLAGGLRVAAPLPQGLARNHGSWGFGLSGNR